jgi:hypothetical protein
VRGLCRNLVAGKAPDAPADSFRMPPDEPAGSRSLRRPIQRGVASFGNATSPTSTPVIVRGKGTWPFVAIMRSAWASRWATSAGSHAGFEHPQKVASNGTRPP